MTMPSQFQSVVDAQIRAAAERGAFDNLRGAGKPIPGLMEPDDPMWWIKGFVEREGVPSGAMLPPSLAMRREIEKLPETLARMRSEKAVRAHVEDLNHRIRRWIQIPIGPQVPLGPVDVDQVVADWQAARAPAPTPAPAAPASRPRWWHRRRAAAQPWSSARWQVMQSATAGRISSRSSGIGAAQCTHDP